MAVYLFLVLIILLKDIISKAFGEQVYVTICFIMFWLVLGFSSEHMGIYDRELVYIGNYNSAKGIGSLSQYLESVKTRATSGYGFYIITWLITRFVNDYHLFLIIITLPIFWCAASFIKKNSLDVQVSCFVFLAFMYPFMFTVVRQCIALSILFIAANAFNENRLIKCILLIFLAASIHITAIVFLLIILLHKIKYRNIYLLAIPVFISLVLISNGSHIMDFISRYTPDTTLAARYQERNSQSFMIAPIMIRTSIFVFLYVLFRFTKTHSKPVKNKKRARIRITISNKRKPIPDENALVKSNAFSNDFFLLISIAICVFSILMSLLFEMQRIILFFDIFTLIAIPQALSGLKKKPYFIVKFLVNVTLASYFFFFQLQNWWILEYQTFF